MDAAAEIGKNLASKHQIQPGGWRMSRLTRDGTAETISRDQILKHERGQGSIYLPCSADHEQDWQPYPGDPYSAICNYRTTLMIYVQTVVYCAVRSSLQYTVALPSIFK